MRDVSKMSIGELIRAIESYEDMCTNASSHGQADDYLVGSWKMVQVYQNELHRREEMSKEKKNK